MSYSVLNLIMLAVIVICYGIKKPKTSYKRLGVSMLILVALTIVFDNLIIAVHIVAYQQAHLLGIYIGQVPLEDLSYSIAACLLVPLLWGKEQSHVE